MARDRYSGRGGERPGGFRSQNGSGRARGGRATGFGYAGGLGDRSGYTGYTGGRGSGGTGGGGGGGRNRRAPMQVDLLHSDLEHEAIPRRNVVLALLGLGTLAGVAQLADYQIINAQTYRDEADARRISAATLYAKRGTIYDRNGNVLTSSVECQNVYVNPQLIKDADEAVDALVEILGVDEDDCRSLVEQDTTFAYIKRQVTQDVADELAARKIAGIEFEQAIMRVYPNGNLASQVLGVVNIDNQGISGLEGYYDKVLTGTNGSIMRERARDGSYIAGGAYEKVEAVDGTDLVLTIDMNIQRAAEDALAEAVERTKAAYGSIIVTDPRSGEILACCSNPTYSQTDLANARNEDMNLRVVTDSYEPGSVFKTLVAGMAINEGLMTPDTTFDVPAQVKVGDDMVSDADKRDYGLTMSLREIIKRSSNTGMVLVGEKIGADTFAEYLDLYGIGHSSGIDFPGESMGTIRAREDYDGSTLGSMSFGQGIAVAPIQVTRAVGGLANGGVMVTPHFLQAKGGEKVDWSDGDMPTISADAASQVTSMMVTVVDEGTGTGGKIDGYDVAGKTGTAERAGESGGYEKGVYMASFLGFAPASDPRVLVYVTLDDTPQGSDAAAIPFKSVMETALSVLGIPRTR